MRTIHGVVPALLFAGMAIAQGDGRSDPRDSKAKVPPLEFRSAFAGYRSYADQELRDWRKSNEEVRKPQSDKPESSGGHGGHK